MGCDHVDELKSNQGSSMTRDLDIMRVAVSCPAHLKKQMTPISEAGIPLDSMRDTKRATMWA